MRLDAHGYLDFIDRRGLFPETAVPELNTAVWRRYLNLYAAHAGDIKDIDIVATDAGLAFYRDPLMGEDTFGWALTCPLSHPVLPFTASQILADAPNIESLFAAHHLPIEWLVTDSFVFAAPPSDGDALNFPWVQSPIARFAANFEQYVESLAASRRKQARRLYRQYNDDPAVRFDFSARPPDAAEFAFIESNTHERWKEDAPFALIQALFVIAAAQVMPSQTRFMRVYQNGELVFFNSYIIRGDTITSQSTTRSEKHHLSGLGVMIDFKVIELLTGSAITTLDPTCATSYVDQGSIMTAKREVINTDMARPLFALRSPELPAGAPRFENGVWHSSAEKLIIGRGL